MANDTPNTVYYGNEVSASSVTGYAGSLYKAVGKFTVEINSATEYRVKVWGDVYFYQYTGHTSSELYISTLSTSSTTFNSEKMAGPIYSPTTGTSTNGPWSKLESKITKTHAVQTYYAKVATTNVPGTWSDAILTIKVPAKTSYAVTYSANTTDTVSGMPSNQTKWYNEALTLNTATSPTRTGYSFSGWYTNEAGTGTKYDSSNTNYTTNADLTLYAKWTANTYAVTYNNNTTQNGTFANSAVSGMPSNQTKTYGVSLTLSTGTKPTKASTNPTGITITYYPNGGTGSNLTQQATDTYNYTFSHWYTKASGTGGTSYGNTNSSYTTNAALTLYAQWSISNLIRGALTLKAANTYTRNNSTDSYTITCNANGGNGNNFTATQTNTTYYTFSKWNTAAGGTGSSYNAGTSQTFSSNTSLYAIWNSTRTNGSVTLPAAYTKNNTTATGYTVTCNYKGNGQSNTTHSQTNTTSYTFSNWNTKADGTGASYNASSSQTFSASTTLYAKWSSSLSKGKVTLPAVNARTGYTFQGWSTTDGGTTVAYADKATFEPTSNITLYAIWSANPYPITYYKNAPTTNDVLNMPANQTKYHDIELTLSSTVPTTTGYTFSKWNTKADGTGTNYNAGASYKVNTGANLYAQWTIWTYAVTYNKNATDSSIANMPDNQTKIWNQTLTLTNKTPTRTGYDFKGWATSSTGSVAYQPNGSYTDNDAVTLYAIWSEKTYTISYNGNNTYNSYTSSTLGNVPSSQTKKYFTDLTLSTTKPTKSNTTANGYTVTFNANGGTVSPASITAVDTYSYTFSSWNTATAGNGTSYASGATFKTNATTTLYAVWARNKTNGTITLPTPTRTGFTFLGWSTSSTATSGTYNGGASYTPSSSHTLYAVWRANLIEGYVLRATSNTATWANLIANQTDTNSTLYVAGGQYSGWAVDSSGYVTCFGSRIKKGTANVKGTDKPSRGATYTFTLS